MNGNESEAERIADLPERDRITSMMFHNNTLYYINGNSELKCKHISRSFIDNSLRGNPDIIYRSLRGMTTAGIGSEGNLYIGIRDSLLLLHGKEAKLVKASDFPFVNRIAVGRDDMTYAALLNGGVLRLHGDSSSVESNSARHRFIKDIAFTSFSSKPCILTNHFLFSPDGRDSVSADGFSRLLTADGRAFYALMENGIRKYIIDRNGIRHIGDTLGDIRFSPSISLVQGKNIYVGATSLGVIMLKPDGISQWVRFNHDVYTLDYKAMIFFFLLICLSAGFILWHRKRKEKDFGIFSDWEKIRKDIAGINPKQAKNLEKENFAAIDSVDRRITAGREWLEHYETVKNKATPLKQLTSLDVFRFISDKGIKKDIYTLYDDIRSRSFDMAECEKLCEKIENCIQQADMRKILEVIDGLYKDNKKSVDNIDTGFAARLSLFVSGCNIPCNNAESAINRIHEANKKLFLIKAAGCITKIKEAVARIKPIVNQLLNEKRKKYDPIEKIRRECSEIINANLEELYYALSQDTLLASEIKIKQRIDKDDIKMLYKEKVLMLLIDVPDIKSEIICCALNNVNLNNTRSTLSKVKKEISSLKESSNRQDVYEQTDSLGKYILGIIKKRGSDD